MLKTSERLNLILAVNKSGLGLRLIKEAKTESLLKLCSRLEENKTPPEWYSEQMSIQKELLKHEQFFFYLQRAVENEKLMPYAVNDYVAMLHAHGESTEDYPENRITASMTAAFEHGYFFICGNIAGHSTPRTFAIGEIGVQKSRAHPRRHNGPFQIFPNGMQPRNYQHEPFAGRCGDS